MAKITAQMLVEKHNEGMSVSDIDKFARSHNPEYPENVSKPTLGRNHTADELKTYNKSFSEYEKNQEDYKAKKDAYNKSNNEVNEALTEFVKLQTGFYDNVPEDKQSKVWSKAWSDGHSSGYYQVYYELEELVDLFS